MSARAAHAIAAIARR